MIQEVSTVDGPVYKIGLSQRAPWDALVEWLITEMPRKGRRRWLIIGDGVSFRSYEDAVLFSLRWCGQER